MQRRTAVSKQRKTARLGGKHAARNDRRREASRDGAGSHECVSFESGDSAGMPSTQTSDHSERSKLRVTPGIEVCARMLREACAVVFGSSKLVR